MNNCGSEYVTPKRAHPHYDDHSPLDHHRPHPHYDDHSPPDHHRPHPHYDDHSPPDHRRPHPHYNNESPPDQRYCNVEPKVKLRRSGSDARKKLLYQDPLMFGQQPAAGQGSSFTSMKQGEKGKFSPKCSSFLKNKLNGRYQPIAHQSPKVSQIHFL